MPMKASLPGKRPDGIAIHDEYWMSSGGTPTS